MDSDKLDVRIQIANCGSVQGAACQSDVNRSSLRRGLELLETEVGARLFRRDAAGIRLTAGGFADPRTSGAFRLGRRIA